MSPKSGIRVSLKVSTLIVLPRTSKLILPSRKTPTYGPSGKFTSSPSMKSTAPPVILITSLKMSAEKSTTPPRSGPEKPVIIAKPTMPVGLIRKRPLPVVNSRIRVPPTSSRKGPILPVSTNTIRSPDMSVGSNVKSGMGISRPKTERPPPATLIRRYSSEGKSTVTPPIESMATPVVLTAKP